MTLVIKVRELLDTAISREQDLHQKTHQIEESIAAKDTFCLHCKNPISQGTKVLLCHYTFELGGCTSSALFCSQACHDQWLKNEETFRPEIMYFEVIPQVCNVSAFIDVFRSMFQRIQDSPMFGEGFNRIVESIELPIICWDGVELTPSEQRYWNELYPQAYGDCQGAISRALHRPE